MSASGCDFSQPLLMSPRAQGWGLLLVLYIPKDSLYSFMYIQRKSSFNFCLQFCQMFFERAFVFFSTSKSSFSFLKFFFTNQP